MSLNVAEDTLAWMGGFFDGEGSFGLYRQKYRTVNEVRETKRLCVDIVNTERILLLPFLVFGGGVYRHSKANACNSESFVWGLRDRKRVLPFLKTILPYIRSPKKLKKIQVILDGERERVMKEAKRYELVLH